MKRVFIAAPALLVLLAGFAPRAAGAEGDWEKFPDGSTGRVTDFRGAGGVVIAAYVRKPAGPGPFPVVVNLHGGNPSVESTYRAGRATQGLVAQYVAAGWAIYAIDYRAKWAAPMDPAEYDDTTAAIDTARHRPFVDSERVALTGGSQKDVETYQREPVLEGTLDALDRAMESLRDPRP